MNNKQRQHPNRKKMRNAVMLLTTLALAVSFVGTAAAKKGGGKPSPEPVLYDVIMTFDTASDTARGLTTEDCTADGKLVMRLEDSRSGSLLIADGTSDTSEANLWLAADMGVDRCYGAYQETNLLSSNPGPGFFRIIFDRTGTIEKITWHFDVEAVKPPREHGKGDLFVVLHKYALTSQTVEWTDTHGTTVELTATGGTGVVVGSFELWDYTNTDAEGPVWDPAGEPELVFTMTINPHE